MNIRKQNGDVKRQEAAKITGAALEAINSVDGGKKINTPEYSQTVVNEGPKIGRNDPCPCGSGKKYKNCCGRNQQKIIKSLGRLKIKSAFLSFKIYYLIYYHSS